MEKMQETIFAHRKQLETGIDLSAEPFGSDPAFHGKD